MPRWRGSGLKDDDDDDDDDDDFLHVQVILPGNGMGMFRWG